MREVLLLNRRWVRAVADCTGATPLSQRFRVQACVDPVKKTREMRLNNFRRRSDVTEREMRTVIFYGERAGMESSSTGERGIAAIAQVRLAVRTGLLSLPTHRNDKVVRKEETVRMRCVVGSPARQS